MIDIAEKRELTKRYPPMRSGLMPTELPIATFLAVFSPP